MATIERPGPAARARAWALTPLLAAFVASGRVRQHGPAAYRVARRLDPVHHSPTGVVVLSRHAEAAAVLRDPRFGSDEAHADLGALRSGLINRVGGRGGGPSRTDRPYLQLHRRLLVFLDPPDHTRIRTLVSKTFTPRRVERLEGRVEEIVDELLAPALAAGRTEFMADVAYPLPARVICELVGVPPADYPLFVEHAPGLAGSLDPSPMVTEAAADAADAAVEALTGYLDGLIAARRARPGDDLLSALIAAEDGGATLSHDELVATVLLLVMAGHETTANVLGNAVARLVRDPASRASLATLAAGDGDRSAAGPSLRTAVEEFLRLDGPVQMAGRVTLEPVQLGGVEVPAGRIVLLVIASANRDAAAFPDPARLDLGRSPNPHLSFGGGPHYCIGASLARLELRVALRALAQRLPADARFAGPVTRRPSFTIRGLSTLPLTW
jgi:pimeloyl-[acyl-carrier protein] synthase